MPTGSEFVNATLKRFLSQNRIANEIIDYLQENAFDIGARIFPSQGLFTFPVTITPGVGSFDLSIVPAGAIEGTDGLGHTLSLELARQVVISYEDDGINIYWIGMKYIEVPNGMIDNPRTGKPEYDKVMEEIGEMDTPTSTADAGGGQILINVNSIFEAAVDHSGRTVRVWLVNPQSGDEAVAFEDCVVNYAAPNNTITTTGSLGQSTISGIAADYVVACFGVTVRKSVLNPFGDEYLIIGNIDSSGPAADNGDEVDLSGGGGHTIQAAYDGVGAGAGRNATLDNGAIQLTQSSAVPFDKDVSDAVLRARKANDLVIPPGGFNYEGAFDAVMRIIAHYGYMHRAALADLSGNDELRHEEVVDLVVGTATVNFTRVGVDLTFAGGGAGVLQIATSMSFGDLIEISGSASGQDGVYIISAVLAGSVDVVRPDGTVPVFIGEVGLSGRIYRPVMRSGAYGTGILFSSLADFLFDIGMASPNITSVVPTAIPNTPGLVVTLADGSKTVEIRPNDIRTDDGTTITTVGGQHKFSAPRTFYKTIPASSGDAEWANATAEPSWEPVHIADGAGSCPMTSRVAGDYVAWNVDLPDGATITTVDILCQDGGGGVGNEIDFEMVRYQADWAIPAASIVTSFSTKKSTGGGAVEKVTMNLIAEVVNNQTRSYQLRAIGKNVGEKIFDIRITYTHTELHY